MARWTACAKWAAGPAHDGRRDTLLVLGLNEGLGVTAAAQELFQLKFPAEGLQFLKYI